MYNYKKTIRENTEAIRENTYYTRKNTLAINNLIKLLSNKNAEYVQLGDLVLVDKPQVRKG